MIRRLVNDQELDDMRKRDNFLAPVDPDDKPRKVTVFGVAMEWAVSLMQADSRIQLTFCL